jgi:polyisoprenoid-binding protein YceI
MPQNSTWTSGEGAREGRCGSLARWMREQWAVQGGLSMRINRPVMLLIGLSLFVPAQTAQTQEHEPTVAFTVEGPNHFDVKGTTDSLQLRRNQRMIELTVPLGTLTTGLRVRDAQMREKYLEVYKYPTAQLEIVLGSVRRPGPGEEIAARLTGSLRLHGNTREVSVLYTVRRNGKTYLVRSSTHIDMRDFGVAVPSWLGSPVKPDVDISAVFQADDRQLD